MFSGASNFVDGVDTAFLVILGISIFFLIAITAVMILFIIKYNKKRNPVASKVRERPILEITWTVIPIILVIVMFYYGWTGFKPMKEVPKDAINIKATARMWSWNFEYKNGKTSNTLKVPMGKAIKIDLVSMDVLHSLYIPAFRLKEDIVPGKDNFMWFIAEQLGEYDIFCAEYCGMQHSAMLSKVEVLNEQKYLTWYGKEKTEEELNMPLGLQLINKHGCKACHTFDGSTLVGPSFKDLFERNRIVITDGKKHELKADKEYFKRSLYEPNADVVKGFNKGLMIIYKDQISEEEIDSLIEYIETL